MRKPEHLRDARGRFVRVCPVCLERQRRGRRIADMAWILGVGGIAAAALVAASTTGWFG